jgi:hypothetical protein
LQAIPHGRFDRGLTVTWRDIHPEIVSWLSPGVPDGRMLMGDGRVYYARNGSVRIA